MGGLHPHWILLLQPSSEWSVYVPELHSIGPVHTNPESSSHILKLVKEHHLAQDATILCLIADCDLVANYYENFESLLLRDGGVLFGHASLVAAAHELSFRILGRTGTHAAETIVVDLPFRAFATGLALLGG
jgi:hypothetical protein